MSTLRLVLITAAVALVLGLGGGLAFGWHEWRPQTVVETAAPSVRQQDSSVVLQRVPSASAKPAQIIPKGATVERVDHVVVQPRATVIADSTDKTVPSFVSASSDSLKPNPLTSVIPSIAADVPRGTTLCPPVRVDLTLVRMTDNSERVIASSPDGIVLDSLSIDHPVAPTLAPAKALVWSAGPIWGGGDNGVGVNLTRDLGPIRLVSAVLRAPSRGTIPVHAVALLAGNIRF